jgi:hypothetical protein
MLVECRVEGERWHECVCVCGENSEVLYGGGADDVIYRDRR